MHRPRTDRLYPELLRAAYAQGYFPMPHPETDEIMWFRPDPRAVIPLDGFHVSQSLRRTLKRGIFSVTRDTAFTEVMLCCADREETWITPEFLHAYGQLHEQGHAHSVEVWDKMGNLVGGVYGVSLGGAFFAESKFHRSTDASKVALYHLVEHLRSRKFLLLEVQFMTPHLARLGATPVSDSEYQKRLAAALVVETGF